MESYFFNLVTDILRNVSGVKLILILDDNDIDVHGITSDENFEFGMYFTSFDEFMSELVRLVQIGGNYKYVMTGTHEDLKNGKELIFNISNIPN